jgi:hypothetical protein
MVQQGVRKAFKAVGDLAIDVTLTQKDSSSFNFATGTVATTTPVTTVVKAVLNAKRRDKRQQGESPENNTLVAELLMISEDLSDLSVYDTATFNGNTWRISHPVEDNGYTTTVTVTRAT